MRGQRPACRVGRSDSRVTGTAAGANLAAMLAILQAVTGTLRSALRRRASLVAENLVLRQQLAILRRATPRPRLRPIDRAFWVIVARAWSRPSSARSSTPSRWDWGTWRAHSRPDSRSGGERSCRRTWRTWRRRLWNKRPNDSCGLPLLGPRRSQRPHGSSARCCAGWRRAVALHRQSQDTVDANPHTARSSSRTKCKRTTFGA